MSSYQNTIAKLNQLPEPLLQEVNDFIDFLLLKQNQSVSSLPITNDSQNLDTLTFMQLAETGFSEWHDPEEDIYNDPTPGE